MAPKPTIPPPVDPIVREHLLYSIVYGPMDEAEIEWSGARKGQGSGPHGSGSDGYPYAACPTCGGLEKPNSEFSATAVGHRHDCALAMALGSPRNAPMHYGDAPSAEDYEI